MTNNGVYKDLTTGLSTPCSLVVENQSLLIYQAASGESMLIWQIKTLKSCEFVGGELSLVNAQHPSKMIVCQGEIAKQIYEQWLSDEKPIEKTKNPLFVIRLVFWSTILLVSVVLGFYYYLLPYAAEKAVRLIPPGTEREIGEAMADKLLLGSSTNDSATYYAAKLIGDLKFETVYPITIHVVKSNDINAFALPGGHIFVYSAMIQGMQTIEQWVALIGHEQAHVKNQHSLKNISRQAAATLLIASLFGDISGISTGLLSQVQQFEQLNYSRELETEADDEGLKFMIKNNYNPQGMVQLLDLLNAETAKTPALMHYLSTHPDTESRILNVKSQLLSKSDVKEADEKDKAYFQKMKSFVK